MSPPALEQLSGTLVDSNVDKVLVGVAHVKAADSAMGTHPLARGRLQEWRRAS